MSIALGQAALSVTAGDVFDLDIVIGAGSQGFNGAQAYLGFPAGALEVVPYQASPLKVVRPGTGLPVEIPRANAVAAVDGRVSYAAGLFNATASGSVVLGTVRFRAKAPGDYAIGFEFDPGDPTASPPRPMRYTKVTYVDGSDLLQGQATGAVVHVRPVAIPEEQRITLGVGWNWFSLGVAPFSTGLGPNPTSLFRDYSGAATLDGAALPAGSVVEAFNPRGDLVGSFTVYTAGSYGDLRVYGENGAASPPVPGMREGEAITFKVNGYPATTVPSPVVWQNGTVPARVDLAATSTLPVAEALAALEGKFDYVLGETGTYAQPGMARVASTLASLEAGKTYFIRMREGAELVVRGRRPPAGTPIQLTPGWHWIGYLPATGQELPGALGSIAGKYDLVLGDGVAFAPPPAPPFLNTLTGLRPGGGYLIRMTQEGTLVYGGG